MPWATEPKPTKNYWVVNNEKISRENRVIINDFLTSLKIENKSASTAEQYSKGLERFFLHCQKEIGELTSDDIKDWLDARYWDKKPKTISSAISILSSFFTFCESEEYIDKKLIKNSWRPKIPHTLPIYLEKNDQARVKISAETTTLRDRLILELLLSSGCRRSELAKLNTEDIDTSNKTAWVMGKGGKARIVHFSETCTILLEEYLSIHPDDEQALYLNRLGNRLDDNGIYRVISKIGKQANLSSKLYPHRLRHTFATNLLAKGEELVYISDKLGHKDLNTTRIYARLPQEVIISLYRKYMG
ncbi:MAG: hypothetical protein JL56_09385 [Desulfotomaculum sp. BICA1-6]|nr:MAG: hypothetical protein VR67_09995 [Peptococcaceae bacterium BRH_c8a]KJS74366.1 MAG: hypothetical protein JL56_09385 [Desulfotomaculum sp. BICA1-6]